MVQTLRGGSSGQAPSIAADEVSPSVVEERGKAGAVVTGGKDKAGETSDASREKMMAEVEATEKLSDYEGECLWTLFRFLLL